jgi:hypothetical protein
MVINMNEETNMEFRVDSIPKKYHGIMDELWSCTTQTELRIYLTSCSPQKRQIAETLMELVRMEILDNHFEKNRDRLIDPNEFNDMMNRITTKNKN